MPHACVATNKMFEIFKKWDILSELKIIHLDKTPTNTGWKGGVFSYFEELLGRKLYHAECQLHLVELPLRSIIEEVIGERECKTKLKGDIGVRLIIATELPSNEEY